MNIYTKCGGCGTEGRPRFIPGSPSYAQFGQYAPDRYEPPEHWQTIDGTLLCGVCVTRVRGAIAKALVPPPGEAPAGPKGNSP